MKKYTFSLIVLVFGMWLLMGSCGNEKKDANNLSPKKSGQKSEKKEAWKESELSNAKQILSEVTEGDIQSVNAKSVYATQCVSCHGPKGKMEIGGSKKLTESKLDLTTIVTQVYYGKGLMTPYHKILSKEEIVAVSHYVKNMQQ